MKQETNIAWTEESLRELFAQHNVPYVEMNGIITIDTKAISNFNKKAHTVLFPVCFHTVDIAIVRPGENDQPEILLIQKHSEKDSGKWRLPGGFMDPGETAHFAAAREMNEECGIVADEDQMIYVDSLVIDDARMKNGPHSITTSLYLHIVDASVTPIAGDDAAEIKWVQLNESSIDVINPIHKELFLSVIGLIEEISQF